MSTGRVFPTFLQVKTCILSSRLVMKGTAATSSLKKKKQNNLRHAERHSRRKTLKRDLLSPVFPFNKKNLSVVCSSLKKVCGQN